MTAIQPEEINDRFPVDNDPESLPAIFNRTAHDLNTTMSPGHQASMALAHLETAMMFALRTDTDHARQ